MAFVSPRKIMRAKRVLQTANTENPQIKSVTFSDEIIETSIGGTQRVGKIKKDLLFNFEAASSKSTPSKVSAQNYTNGLAKSDPVAAGKENKEATSSAKNKPVTVETTANLTNGYSKTSSDFIDSPVTSLRSSNGKGRPKVKLLSEKPESTPDKKDQQGNVTIRSSRNSKDFLDIDPREKYDNSNSSSDSLLTGDDRRTTLEHIDSVAQSPFQAPQGKYARRHTMGATPECFRDVKMGSSRLISYISEEDDSEAALGEGEDSCSVMVAVRVRPFCQRELADSNVRCAVTMQGNETTVVSDSGSTHRFVYDFSFWSHDDGSSEFCNQEVVYQKLAQPLLGKALEGYNTCLFAYGQTGSGKSYSIMGRPNDVGIIPRFCLDLFNRADVLTNKKKVKVKVEISFFEIYNEKIHDLLASSKEKGGKKTTLKVREHPMMGPYVEGLNTYIVNSFDDVEGWITIGNKNRATAATGMNDKSSRSHSVFTIVLQQTKIDVTEGQEHEHCVNSKINLVDLAGSERQSSAQTHGERLREGACINKSLLTLGKVISLLCDRSQANKRSEIFIPYRESVLTWLLKESLGGNSKTAMIATISPSNQHIEETLSTLRYAQQARSIVNVVRINEDPMAKLIRQLTELRRELERLKSGRDGSLNEEALAAEIAKKARLKCEKEEMIRSLKERLFEAETKRAEEMKLKEKPRITLKVDNTLPNLVNLNEDPQLSELLLYIIREGESKVGRNIDETSAHDIKLTGPLIADHHCIIRNIGGIVDITPIDDAPTYVNGNLMTETTVLHHGDRVVLGDYHYFRFNHPIEVQKNKDKDGRSIEVKDFEFAKQELLRVQEAKLQEMLQIELEKSKKEIQQQQDGYESKLKGLESALTQVKLTNKEAENKINSLKKQNLMLEREILDGRSKAQETVEIIMESRHFKLPDMLQAGIDLTRETLDYRRQKLQGLMVSRQISLTARPLASLGSPSSGKDLYKISLLVREANKISEHLKTNLRFAREDIPTGGSELSTQIRVVNTRHRMFTLWPLARFEAKLAEMRDMYENDDDTGDNEVFNDPEDIWEKESSFSSPQIACSRLANLSDVPRTPLSAFRAGANPYSPRSSEEIELTAVKALKYLLSSVEDTLKATEESAIDKILVVCQRIKDNEQKVKDCVCQKSKKGAGWSRPMSQVIADIHALALLVSQRLDDVCYAVNPTWAEDLPDRLADHVKVIRDHASSMLQGCESQLPSLTSESGHKLTIALTAFCETCGELAVSTQSRVLQVCPSEVDYSHRKVSLDIIQHFMAGCRKMATQTLENCMATVESLDLKCDGDSDVMSLEMSRRLDHVLSCIQALLQKTLQISLAPHDGAECHTPQFYEAVYKRLLKVVSYVSSVVGTCRVLLVTAESLVLGSTLDSNRLKICMEKILQQCQQLLSALSWTYAQPTPSPPSYSNSTSSTVTSSSSSSSSYSTQPSSDLTEVSLLSESQQSYLDSAIQEVSMAASLFTEYLNESWSGKAGPQAHRGAEEKAS